MTTTSDWPLSNTNHGLLVAFGEFLQQHGLIQQLMQVPIPQKTITFAPQTKMIEFLAGTVSGIEYLSDLNDGPQPLAQDTVVARAWGQKKFAHYSSVSRTLDCCDDDTLQAVEQTIETFSRPFIRTAVHELMRTNAAVVYDLDLMGQGVSPTSTTYPEVAFGWMDERVQLGYQVARICFRTHTQERIWLRGFHHPGDTVSVNCVQELIRAAEVQTGIRPRRRTELLRQRLAAHATHRARPQRLLAQQQTKHAHLQATQLRLQVQLAQAAQSPKRSISPSERARVTQRAAGWQARLPRLAQQIANCERAIAQHQAALRQLDQEVAVLQDWLHTLEADNQTNPNPPVCEARMDSGFSSGANLTWLIEMGYQVNTKAIGGLTTTALRKTVAAGAAWTRVGDNAEMVLCTRSTLHRCVYPLRLGLERFKVRDTYQYATLVQFRDAGATPSLCNWFMSYNGRQLIEAGNKESKSGVFHVQHLMSRAPAGIRLQVLFATLAANLVHWSTPWLRSCAAPLTPKLSRTLNSPKHLVRIAANSAALVQQTPGGTSLRFAPTSALPGIILMLKGIPAFQLPLELFFTMQNRN
jgi:hypothetical protein